MEQQKTSKEVLIEATYVGEQPILSIIEACLDLEKVQLRRKQHAVKAIFPLDLIITVASIHTFERLVLDPLLDPIAQKFNWVTAVGKLIRPTQPFNVTVRIRDSDFIEAPLELDHALVGQVWSIIHKAIAILRAEGRESRVTKLRITSASPGSALVLAYSNSRPEWVVDIENGHTTAIGPTP